MFPSFSSSAQVITTREKHENSSGFGPLSIRAIFKKIFDCSILYYIIFILEFSSPPKIMCTMKMINVYDEKVNG